MTLFGALIHTCLQVNNIVLIKNNRSKIHYGFNLFSKYIVSISLNELSNKNVKLYT